MNPESLEPVRWTRRRWVGTIAAIFALQASLVFALGRRAQAPPVRPVFGTAIHLAVDEESSRRLTELPGLDDPLLLAQPHLRGFSGPAWLKFSTLEYQPSESPEQASWLELPPAALGSSFIHFVQTNRISPLIVADKPLPPLIRYEPRFPNEIIRAESSLQLQGELSGRALAAPLPLRSWVHSEMLSNSVVQVAVDPDGMTFSPVLLAESGLAEADALALRLAADARFQPLSKEARAGIKGTGFVWGRMIFRWHAVAAPLTNPPVVNP
jgi:hypothetical protein